MMTRILILAFSFQLLSTAALSAPPDTEKSAAKESPAPAPGLSKTEKEFMTAAETGDSQKLNQLLKNPDLNINMQDPEKMTPLMAAALTGQDIIMKTLLKTGKADLELKNNVGDTALAVAIANEQYEVAKLLVEAGSNIQVKVNGSEGVTPFMLAVDNDLPLAKKMYKKEKSVLEQQDMNGNTALLRAVMNENIPAIQYLMSVGASKVHKNKAGLTAPLIANKSDNKKLKNVLIK